MPIVAGENLKPAISVKLPPVPTTLERLIVRGPPELIMSPADKIAIGPANTRLVTPLKSIGPVLFAIVPENLPVNVSVEPKFGTGK